VKYLTIEFGIVNDSEFRKLDCHSSLKTYLQVIHYQVIFLILGKLLQEANSKEVRHKWCHVLTNFSLLSPFSSYVTSFVLLTREWFCIMYFPILYTLFNFNQDNLTLYVVVLSPKQHQTMLHSLNLPFICGFLISYIFNLLCLWFGLLFRQTRISDVQTECIKKESLSMNSSSKACKFDVSCYGVVIMGVRRLFSRGGQNFPGGGAKTYYLPKRCLKTYYFH